MFFVTFTLADWMTLSGHALCWIGIWSALMGNVERALCVLILAMLIDALDGKVARSLGIARPFGRYLGSFVDLINYTVAPPLILHHMGFQGPGCLLLLFLYSTCGMVRLAKFNEVGNVEQEGQLAYLGLPVFWVHFLLMILYGVKQLASPQAFLAATTVGLGVLSPCFLLDRPFYKPQNYKLIGAITVVAALTFGWLDWRR